MRGGESYREELTSGRWAAMSLFLRSLAARRECGPVAVGRFMAEYRRHRAEER